MAIERQFLAHYIDASFGDGSPNYVRLGRDLTEYNIELNPDVEVQKNIWGERSVKHNGYEVQSTVEPYYAEEGDPLYKHLEKIINERLTNDEIKTTQVDVLVKYDGTVVWAYRENVEVVPTSMGGDTSGVQIPFTIYNTGNRVKGNWDIESKAFTPET